MISFPKKISGSVNVQLKRYIYRFFFFQSDTKGIVQKTEQKKKRLSFCVPLALFYPIVHVLGQKVHFNWNVFIDTFIEFSI